MNINRLLVISTSLVILLVVFYLPRGGFKSNAAEIQMQTYYVAILKRGPEWTAERRPDVVRVSKGHRDNIDRLMESGEMSLAGPFMTDVAAGEGALAGLFIFNVASMEEAVALAEADPAVIAGRFTVEVHGWYGPKGITYEGRD